jgi:hypothetical protein
MTIPRTSELADKIVEALAEDNLYKVTHMDGFPSRWTVLRWMDEDSAFATRCARAEKLRAQKRAAQIEELANQCSEDNFQSMKVKISTAQWLASKEDARYGDKIEHTGADGGPIQFVAKSILETKE